MNIWEILDRIVLDYSNSKAFIVFSKSFREYGSPDYIDGQGARRNKHFHVLVIKGHAMGVPVSRVEANVVNFHTTK